MQARRKAVIWYFRAPYAFVSPLEIPMTAPRGAVQTKFLRNYMNNNEHSPAGNAGQADSSNLKPASGQPENTSQKSSEGAQSSSPGQAPSSGASTPHASSRGGRGGRSAPAGGKPGGRRRPSSGQDKKQPEPVELAEEPETGRAYNLYQDTELWPEAWPEAEEGLPAENGNEDADAAEERENDAPASFGDAMAGAARPEGEVMSALHMPMPPDVHDEEKDLIRVFDEAPAPEYSGDCEFPEQAASPAAEEAGEEGKKKPAAAKAQPDVQRGGKKRKMFVSVLPGEQIEVAITGENQVQEYYVQMLRQVKTKGNIYKGVIHNVDASLQAAFISYGSQKNGFLQIDEVHPDYYLTPHNPSKGKKYPLIQKVLKAGQEVLVQVVKEPTGGKGAFLSTYLSIPGRFLVLTPGRSQFGVSRKVDDEEDRERLKALLDALPTQEGLGVIVRTASLSASKTSMLKDLQVLKRQWKEVRTRGTTEPAPCLVYEEPSLAGRAVRDYLSDDIREIWVDDEETAEEIKATLSLIFPRRANSGLIKMHSQAQKSLWEAFDLQRQIDQIYSREVVLPSGGRLVFDQTEALMAIDINSGKIAGRSNFESMALRTNIEAAQAIAQQLRLRDIGGQIVVDFIEMRERNHWRELEKVMRNAMKSDRARYDVAKVSSFGLMEVVRQRLGSSSISVTMEACPCCNGTGLRRNMEWQALHALRDIQYLAQQKNSGDNKNLVYETEHEVALYLLNNKRGALGALEERYDVSVEIRMK